MGTNPPAHGPYFLRLIREMPHGARKKAQNPPNSCHSRDHTNLTRYSEPTTAAMFLQRRLEINKPSYPDTWPILRVSEAHTQAVSIPDPLIRSSPQFFTLGAGEGSGTKTSTQPPSMVWSPPHLPLTSQLEHHLAQEDVSKQELLPQNTIFWGYTEMMSA